MQTVRALVRDPLIAFALIGGAFFLLYWALSADQRQIEVTRAVQESLVADFRLLNGRPPTAEDRKRLVDDYVTDELLFREAITRGMHLADKQTKQRLIDKLRFLLTGLPPEPTEEELVNYYAEHTDYYRAEPKFSLEQVFFAKAPADAGAVLADLRAGREVRGDDFWMGRRFDDYGESMLRGMFGQAFLKEVEVAPRGEWIGPLSSPRGVHFVRVTGSRGAEMMPYMTVREQVRQDIVSERTKAILSAEVSKLETRYDVEVER